MLRLACATAIVSEGAPRALEEIHSFFVKTVRVGFLPAVNEELARLRRLVLHLLLLLLGGRGLFARTIVLPPVRDLSSDS